MISFVRMRGASGDFWLAGGGLVLCSVGGFPFYVWDLKERVCMFIRTWIIHTRTPVPLLKGKGCRVVLDSCGTGLARWSSWVPPDFDPTAI